MPVTIEAIWQIKEAGDEQSPGSFLSQLEDRVKSLNIQAEEERRSHSGDFDLPSFWTCFRTQVLNIQSFELQTWENRIWISLWLIYTIKFLEDNKRHNLYYFLIIFSKGNGAILGPADWAPGRRFPGMNILAAFNILNPQAVEREEDDFENFPLWMKEHYSRNGSLSRCM